MIALYIIAGIIAFFAVLLSLNISLRVVFDSAAKENMRVYAKIGFYKIYIIPAKQRKEKKPRRVRRSRRATKSTKSVKEKETAEESKEGLGIPEIFNLVKETGMILLKKFKKHIRVRIYKLDVILASDEAQKTALLYGSAIQSAHYLNEFLGHNFKIYKKPDNIKIIPDFSQIKTEFKIDIKFYMKLINVISLAFTALMAYLNIKNNKN